ncbi:E3 ubiquitin/ISG15 ligase TRIM25-like [Engraulis encrasicolus]|uniref:E3 ubiquitin/ISG15 ligase TRIM25-like n=1 Tax=Engraulis encrasicolus TaxID=184585 RepID=UPI002FCFCF0E
MPKAKRKRRIENVAATQPSMKILQTEDADPYRCPVCLELLNDPVTIPCGHSYCLQCITECWNQEEKKSVDPRCPQCRETFTTRPVLKISVILAELVSKFKTTQPQDAPQQPFAGRDDVMCDFCTGKKLKAVKSCLVCVASYCEMHIQPHYQSAAFKKHTLSKASAELQDNICPQHNRLLDVFCRTDGLCICALCVMEKHQGHDNVLAAKERKEQQKSFQDATDLCKKMLGRRKEELALLVNGTQYIKDAAKEADHLCDAISTELHRHVDWALAKMRGRIKEKQKEAESEAEKTRKELKQEIAELTRKETVLQELAQKDDVHFLQELHQIPSQCATKSFRLPPVSFGLIRKTVNDFKDNVKEACSKFEKKVSQQETTILFEMKDFSKFSGSVKSPPVLLENHPWKILVDRRSESTGTYLAFYLDAGYLDKSFVVDAVLEVINQRDRKNSISQKISHTFCEEQVDWGFGRFMAWDDLMDPGKGFLKDDKVIFLATLWVNREG